MYSGSRQFVREKRYIAEDAEAAVNPDAEIYCYCLARRSDESQTRIFIYTYKMYRVAGLIVKRNAGRRICGGGENEGGGRAKLFNFTAIDVLPRPPATSGLTLVFRDTPPSSIILVYGYIVPYECRVRADENFDDDNRQSVAFRKKKKIKNETTTLKI